MPPKKLIILGAGASGLMASLTAARAGAQVTLLERLPRAGKKLLATGNGRCNLSNRRAMELEFYHSAHPDRLRAVLSAFSLEDTLAFFEDIGLPVRAEGDQLYPHSLLAGAVVDALRFEAAALGVELCTEQAVTAIERSRGGFRVAGRSCARVIVATGGQASPHLGSDGSGYRLLAALGHTRSKLFPGLVQLVADKAAIKGLSGVKITPRIRLLADGARLQETESELLFTDYGLSGPAALALSRAVGIRMGKPCTAALDLLPEWEEAHLAETLRHRLTRHAALPAEEWLLGLLHKRLTLALLRRLDIAPSIPLGTLTAPEAAVLARLAKSYEIPVSGTRGFQDAQVTCGGILLSEFTASLESRLCPGLYACGEVLDADGDCGGFNLQWAWSSGAVAGRSASC